MNGTLRGEYVKSNILTPIENFVIMSISFDGAFIMRLLLVCLINSLIKDRIVANQLILSNGGYFP